MESLDVTEGPIIQVRSGRSLYTGLPQRFASKGQIMLSDSKLGVSYGAHPSPVVVGS